MSDRPLPEEGQIDEREARRIIQEEIRRADAISRLIEDEDVQAVFREIQARWMEAWRRSAVGDTEGRERTYQLLTAADELWERLRQAAEGGRLARGRLEELDRERGDKE